jgi:hypothetical protein
MADYWVPEFEFLAAIETGSVASAFNSIAEIQGHHHPH